MSDLISREALLKEFNQTAIEWLQDGTYQLQFAAGVMCEVMEMVTKAPTVDAIEVVRCGECKYYGYVLTCGCSRIETSEYGIATMKPDDFCSYGERKEVTHEET